MTKPTPGVLSSMILPRAMKAEELERYDALVLAEIAPAEPGEQRLDVALGQAAVADRDLHDHVCVRCFEWRGWLGGALGLRGFWRLLCPPGFPPLPFFGRRGGGGLRGWAGRSTARELGRPFSL